MKNREIRISIIASADHLFANCGNDSGYVILIILLAFLIIYNNISCIRLSITTQLVCYHFVLLSISVWFI